jgi:phospholipase C
LKTPVTRRSLLKGMAVAGAGLAIAELAGCSSSAKTSTPPTSSTGGPPVSVPTSSTIPKVVRKPGSRPNPTLPEGTDTIPKIEHIVVVMMENHSFDNLLGELSRDRPEVEGLTFVDDRAVNWNPGVAGTPDRVTAFPLRNTAQGSDVDQSWQESHAQINGGAMDGFVRTARSTQPMG